MVMKKRAQNLSLTTIILIVLGIAVLVFLIWGFSVGWSNLWQRISDYTGGSNVDSFASGCALACSGEQTAKYCSDVKTITLGDGSKRKGSCETLKSVTGVSCSINCVGKLPKKCSDIIVKGSGDSAVKGQWLSAAGDGKKCEDGTDKTPKVGDWEGKDRSDDKCCHVIQA